MAFITNSRGENILYERLSEIVSYDETITVKSKEGHTLSVSRFLFNFVSDFILPRESDLVFTQQSTDDLASVIKTLSLPPESDLVLTPLSTATDKLATVISYEAELNNICESVHKNVNTFSSTEECTETAETNEDPAKDLMMR